VNSDVANYSLTSEDLSAIESNVRLLATGEKIGYPLSLDLDNADLPMFQCEVGRFKINYTVHGSWIEVVSIMA
jgi:hypothetical protein